MKGGRKGLSREKEALAVHMYESGQTMRAIAEAVDLSEGGVWHVLKRNGLSKRMPRLKEGQLERAVDAYQDGATLAEAAEVGGCSVATIWQHLKSLGLLRCKGRLDEAKVKELRKEQLTPLEIARQINVNLRDVLKLLRRWPWGFGAIPD